MPDQSGRTPSWPHGAHLHKPDADCTGCQADAAEAVAALTSGRVQARHEIAMTVFPKTREWERGYRWYCRDCDKYAAMIFPREFDAKRDAKAHQEGRPTVEARDE